MLLSPMVACAWETGYLGIWVQCEQKKSMVGAAGLGWWRQGSLAGGRRAATKNLSLEVGRQDPIGAEDPAPSASSIVPLGFT